MLPPLSTPGHKVRAPGACGRKCADCVGWLPSRATVLQCLTGQQERQEDPTTRKSNDPNASLGSALINCSAITASNLTILVSSSVSCKEKGGVLTVFRQCWASECQADGVLGNTLADTLPHQEFWSMHQVFCIFCFSFFKKLQGILLHTPG